MILKHLPRYRHLLLSDFLSNYATDVGVTTLKLWLVNSLFLGQDQASGRLSLYLTLAAVAELLAGLFSGAVAERLGVMRAMFAACLVRAGASLATIVVVWLFSSGHASSGVAFPAVTVLVMLTTASDTVYFPAAASTVNRLTESADLIDVLSLIRFSSLLGGMAGPAVAGFAATRSLYIPVLATEFLSLLVAAFMVRLMRRMHAGEPAFATAQASGDGACEADVPEADIGANETETTTVTPGEAPEAEASGAEAPGSQEQTGSGVEASGDRMVAASDAEIPGGATSTSNEAATPGRRSFWAEWAAGMRTMASIPAYRTLMPFALIEAIAASGLAFGLVFYFSDSLGSPEAYGVYLSVVAFGYAVGYLLAGRASRRFSFRRLLLASQLGVAACLLFMAATSNAYLAIAAGFALACSQGVLNPVFQSIFVESVEETLVGQAMSVFVSVVGAVGAVSYPLWSRLFSEADFGDSWGVDLSGGRAVVLLVAALHLGLGALAVANPRVKAIAGPS